MRGSKPETLTLSENEQNELDLLVRRHSTPQQRALRGRIILATGEGKNNRQIARQVGVSIDMVRHWRRRWFDLQAVALDDLSGSQAARGCPTSRTTCPDHGRTNPAWVMALACEQPKERPISQWTGREIAAEVMARGIIRQISPRHAARLLKKENAPPHLIRYWLTPPVDVRREETVKAICTVYEEAPRRAQEGEQTVSTDELTGVHALERKHPGLPLAPGKVERREARVPSSWHALLYREPRCRHRKDPGTRVRTHAHGSRFPGPSASGGRNQS